MKQHITFFYVDPIFRTNNNSTARVTSPLMGCAVSTSNSSLDKPYVTDYRLIYCLIWNY